jgi:hypothetical protein
VADHPLRPATDRRLGEPLPHQLANPASAAPTARGPYESPALLLRDYAVLIRLSPGYPPLKDTFRCSTHPFATRRQAEARVTVRLACVKHAASVQSEPGSNSSVQSFCCTLSINPWISPQILQQRAALTQSILLTRILLRLSTLQLLLVSLNRLSKRQTSTLKYPPQTSASNTKHPHALAVHVFKERTPFQANRGLYVPNRPGQAFLIEKPRKLKDLKTIVQRSVPATRLAYDGAPATALERSIFRRFLITYSRFAQSH